MAWGRLDDQFFECEKVQALLGMPGGKAALVLHFSALTYCSRHLTDGELTPAAVQKAAHDAQVSRALALLLVRVKLWEMRRGKRLFIHDYLDYNPSRTEVEAKRREKARAGQAGGLATARARAAAKPQQNCTPIPYPSHTHPIPRESDPPSPPNRGDRTRTGRPRRHRPINDPETASRINAAVKMRMAENAERLNGGPEGDCGDTEASFSART